MRDVRVQSKMHRDADTVLFNVNVRGAVIVVASGMEKGGMDAESDQAGEVQGTTAQTRTFVAPARTARSARSQSRAHWHSCRLSLAVFRLPLSRPRGCKLNGGGSL